MKCSRLAGIFLMGVFLLSASCKDEKKVDVASTIHPEKMATMTTKNVSTLISDSGITQYKIVAPEWRVYDEVDTPYWIFPKGIYLRKYDRKFHVIATVAADSARYLKDRKLWKLDGRVEMTKEPGTLFQTPQLFWDERSQTIYSDSFMHVETPTHVLEGHGFIARQDLTDFNILRPTGIFPVNRDNLQGGGGNPMAAPPHPMGNAGGMTPGVDPTKMVALP